MSDLICRKTMMRCPTPGMCSPHGGCQSQHDRDSSELRRLCAERDQLRTAPPSPDPELVELLRVAADYLRGLSLPAQLVKRIDAKLASLKP